MFDNTRDNREELLRQARQQFNGFLEPLLHQLSGHVDPRLMRSFRESFFAILTGDNARNSILLTSFADAAPVTC